VARPATGHAPTALYTAPGSVPTQESRHIPVVQMPVQMPQVQMPTPMPMPVQMPVAVPPLFLSAPAEGMQRQHIQVQLHQIQHQIEQLEHAQVMQRARMYQAQLHKDEQAQMQAAWQQALAETQAVPAVDPGMALRTPKQWQREEARTTSDTDANSCGLMGPSPRNQLHSAGSAFSTHVIRPCPKRGLAHHVNGQGIQRQKLE